MVADIGPMTLFSDHDVLAIDCEMVGVAAPHIGSPGSHYIKSTLCRVSIVSCSRDGACSVWLDTWVEVSGRIVDFRTAVTGLDDWSFACKSKMTFEEVRRLVQTIIAGKIVVGHAVWNDFAALKIVHPAHLIRDTALFPLLRPPWRLDKLPSLRLLAQHWLQRDIQSGRHDSVEDAKVPLLLYALHQANWERFFGNECVMHRNGSVSIWMMPRGWLDVQEKQVAFSHRYAAPLQSLLQDPWKWGPLLKP